MVAEIPMMSLLTLSGLSLLTGVVVGLIVAIGARALALAIVIILKSLIMYYAGMLSLNLNVLSRLWTSACAAVGGYDIVLALTLVLTFVIGALIAYYAAR